MLTEEYIMNCSDELVSLYNSFIDYCIMQLSQYIKQYYSFDEINRRANIIVLSGQLRKDVTKKIAKLLKISQKKARQILFDAGKYTLDFDDNIYIKAGLQPLQFLQSPNMRNILEAQILNTNGELNNLTRTTAQNVSDEFVQAIDNAELQVQSGLYSYNDAIKTTVKKIVDDGGGTKVKFPHSQYSTQLDVAVRRCVLTGVSQSANALQLQRAKEMKAPYCDTSAHEGARPTHEEWQGKRFRLIDGVDVDLSIPNFLTENFGTAGKPVYQQLQEPNCRHSWYPVMSKDAPMARTKKELKNINDKKVESDGKVYTYYEAEQRLRQMERTVRSYKRRKSALEKLGMDTSHEATKIKQWQSKIRQFVSDTNLKRRTENEQIYY